MPDLEYELQTTKDGHQSLVTNLPGVMSVEVIPDGDTLASKDVLDLSQDEFEDLAAKAMTNHINVDTINSTMTVTPKAVTPKLTKVVG